MILKAYIENYGSQAFDLVDGSVIKTNLNETLDSGAINITNITTKLELFPYQFVKLVSADNTFSKYFIIDNFVETIENLDENILIILKYKVHDGKNLHKMAYTDHSK